MLNKTSLPSLKMLILGIIILGALLFIPSWTLNYWQGWIFMAVFVIMTNLIGIYLALKNPELLQRRMNVGPKAEKTMQQKIIMVLAFIVSIALLIFCSFDNRFSWSPVPPVISLFGDALVAFGLLVNLLVFRENTYAASTVQVFDNQKVISTGFYGFVRHPLYVGIIIMLIGIPLALNSWLGLLIVIFIEIPVIVMRLLAEEKTLQKELPGYKEYMQKVKYRLVPFFW